MVLRDGEEHGATFQLKTGALTVENCIQRHIVLANIDQFISECLTLMADFIYVSVSFIMRDRNTEADNLVSLARSCGSRIWLGDHLGDQLLCSFPVSWENLLSNKKVSKSSKTWYSDCPNVEVNSPAS